MPVIYSFDCMISIRYIESDAFIHLLREQYEAYTVWSFMVRCNAAAAVSPRAAACASWYQCSHAARGARACACARMARHS